MFPVWSVLNFFELFLNICLICLQYAFGKILVKQVAVSCNGTYQQVLCARDVKLPDIDENNIKKDTESNFVSGYVLRKLIVYRQGKVKQKQNL